MAFNLPLPGYESLGDMIQNSLAKHQEGRLREEQIKNALIKNRYAEPEAQASLEKSKLANEYSKNANPLNLERMRMSNELSQKMNPLNIQRAEIQNRFLEPEAQARLASSQASTNRLNQLLPYDIQEAKLRPDVMRAQIENSKALAQNRSQGVSGMGVGGKALMSFKNQLAFEHPDWSPQQLDQAASSYLEGSNKGLPPLSGMSKSLIAQAQRYNAPVGVQNQAATMAITASELNDIPVDNIAKFAGPLGKMNYAYERTKMLTNPESVSPEFREYKAYQDEISILAMDTLRKGFGTSVVPDYVYDTLGKALNPQTSWWNDPKQVSKDLRKLQEWVNKNSRALQKQVRGGVTADISEKQESSPENDPLGIR
jgi:hypothetical protein